MFFVAAAGALWVLAGQNTVAAEPSVAVLPMEARGIHENTAKLASDALTQALRDSGVFTRVVSSADLEAALGFERQKQLLSCDASGCMAELAAGMGVQFLATGSVGVVGELRILNIRLIQVRDARTSSVSRQARGDEALFLSVPGAVNELLKTAGFNPAQSLPVQPSPTEGSHATAPPQGVSQVAAKQQATPAPAPDNKVESGRSVPRWVGFILAGGGAFGLATGPLVLLAGVAGAFVAGIGAQLLLFNNQRSSADVVAAALSVGVLTLVVLGSLTSVVVLACGIYLSI